MSIVCVGAGYVGGPTMAVIAEKCPDIKVTVIDIDQSKINAWASGNIPIKEPKLSETVEKSRNKNLFFKTDVDGREDLATADLIFIAVGTPTKMVGAGAGKASLVDYVESAARFIGEVARKSTIIVEKSTVPVGISRSIRTVLNANSSRGLKFQILSNPEFLAEGTAIDDLHNPDRIIIGCEQTPEGHAAADVLKSVYTHWIPAERILTLNIASSELSKLTANAFLAQRISSINSIACICEKTGADISEIGYAIGTDSRIGSKFLKASVGFGGSCFQKDILNLVYICESLGLTEVAQYWQSVVDMNNYQRSRFVWNVVHTMFDTIQNKEIAIFGFAFKADTGDTRESSAITVANMLLLENAIIHIYDPMVSKEQIYSDLLHINERMTTEKLDRSLKIFDDPYKCVKGTHAILVMTEWPCFKDYDYSDIYNNMKKPAFLFDGRNLLNRDELRRIGFCTHGIGVVPDSLAQ